MDQSLRDLLRGTGADTAFADMGLDFETLFPAGKTEGNRYAGHVWKVVRAHGMVIINAVPPVERQDTLFWEEWFRRDGKTYHHIMRLAAPATYDEVFVCPPSDDVHPSEVFGKSWYVVNDRDMSPVLYRT